MTKRKRGLLLLLCMVLLLSSSITVSAGSLIHVLDNTSFEKELDSAQWHNANGDIYVEKGRIVFPKESTADTRLVWKSVASDSGVYNELFSADATMQIQKLPKGENFIFAFGLKTVEAFPGDTGNVEVAFQNKNGIKVKVTAYNKDGEAVEVVKETSIGASLNQNISVHADVTVKGVLNLTINGKTLCRKEKLPVTGVGRIGFLQTGSCAATVSDVQFKTYEYDTPENCNIDEDFNDGTFNVNKLNVNLTQALLLPGWAMIEDYNGEKALVFKNAYVAYISTKYKYSNFELEFDVLYMKNIADVDENGTILCKKTDNFIIRYGCDVNEFTSIAWDGSSYSDSVVVGNGSGISSKFGGGRSEKHLFQNEENEGRGYSIKLTMIDNELTGYIKWLDEKEYTQVFVANNPSTQTPNGFIHIIAQDTGNIVFDNLKITNRDKNAATLDVEYKSNVFRDVPDYDYTQQEIVYMQKPDEKTFNWYLVPLVTAGIGVVAVGLTTGITLLKHKKKSKKAGESNEEK